MSVEVKSPTGDFQGERRLADFREGQLVLTERRIHYMNPDSIRLEFRAFDLAKMDEVSLLPYSRFRPKMLLVPFGLMAIGFLLSMTGSVGPFIVASIIALWSLRLAWFSDGMFAIRLATAQDRLEVPVPKHLQPEARGFVRAVHQALPRDRPAGEAAKPQPAPTTRPFRG